MMALVWPVLAVTLCGQTSNPPASPEPAAAPAPAPDAGAQDATLVRIDVEDGFALHPWIYHEVRFSELVGLLIDVHAQTPGRNARFPEFAELDIGPNLHFGNLQVNPQLGVDLAWKSDTSKPRTKFADLLAQLFILYNDGLINAESWNMLYLPFEKGAAKFFQARLLASVTLPGGVNVGPHGELTWVEDVGLDRKALGADIGFARPWGQVVIFLADELTRDVLEMRLTYLRAF